MTMVSVRMTVSVCRVVSFVAGFGRLGLAVAGAGAAAWGAAVFVPCAVAAALGAAALGAAVAWAAVAVAGVGAGVAAAALRAAPPLPLQAARPATAATIRVALMRVAGTMAL